MSRVLAGFLCAVGCLGACGAPTDEAPGAVGKSAQAITVSDIPGLYFFDMNTQRGTLDGNWSFHADGTFFEVSNGVELPSGGGTWTTDGQNIALVQNIPYGNTCHFAAPLTANGFASPSNPSTQATCTFNHLKPNPRRSWYATKLQ
jgi:hypothetical protein